MRLFLKLLIGAVLGIILLPYLVIHKSAMPEGTDLSSPFFGYSEVELFLDRTYFDEENQKLYLEHTIFDQMLAEIESAETFLILDFFFWNPWKGSLDKNLKINSLSKRLISAIVDKRKERPEMPILIVTDPINRLYGSSDSKQFEALTSLGIPVIYTDLSRLRDPNFLYSKQVHFWSKFYPEKPEKKRFRFIPNPMDWKGDKLSFHQLAKSFHLKSNHRKVLISGHKDKASRILIGSLNPADSGALNSNMAVLIEGPVADYAARSELMISRWSSMNPSNLQGDSFSFEDTFSRIDYQLMREVDFSLYRSKNKGVRYLSEGSIKRALIDLLNEADSETEIDISIFYMSDRKLIRALKSALKRGAQVRLLMDQNKNSFGFKKLGIPNRCVADELMNMKEATSLEIRWVPTTQNGQYHTKAFRFYNEGNDILLLGSANLTQRSLNNFNLEANVLFNSVLPVSNQFDQYFESVWNNAKVANESLAYGDLKNPQWVQFIRVLFYRFQEWTQLSKF